MSTRAQEQGGLSRVRGSGSSSTERVGGSYNSLLALGKTLGNFRACSEVEDKESERSCNQAIIGLLFRILEFQCQRDYYRVTWKDSGKSKQRKVVFAFASNLDVPWIRSLQVLSAATLLLSSRPPLQSACFVFRSALVHIGRLTLATLVIHPQIC